MAEERANAAAGGTAASGTAADGTARRTFLIGGTIGAGVLGAGVLTGCGAGSASGTPLPPKLKGKVLVKIADVPVGGGKIDFDDKVVFTQPEKGTFKAFTAVCTHRGCTVSEVQSGVIMCSCHGSEFSIKDGSVKQGPAKRPLTAYPVTVKGDGLAAT